MSKDFFVYVIESPSPEDLYEDRGESELIAKAASLDSIECIVRTVVSKAMLLKALSTGLVEAMDRANGIPILHLSAHGSKEGIRLSSGDFVNWATLREALVPINRALDWKLILCMSACEGFYACTMAMKPERQAFLAFVANHGNPTWAETAVGYAAFYHRLSTGSPIEDAVAAMSAASGNSDWVAESAASLQERYTEYLAKKRFQEALALLRSVSAKS